MNDNDLTYLDALASRFLLNGIEALPVTTERKEADSLLSLTAAFASKDQRDQISKMLKRMRGPVGPRSKKGSKETSWEQMSWMQRRMSRVQRGKMRPRQPIAGIVGDTRAKLAFVAQPQRIRNLLTDVLIANAESMQTKYEQSFIGKKFADISQSLNLNSAEDQFIKYMFLASTRSAEFDEIMEALEINNPASDFAMMAKLVGISASDYRECVGDKGVLRMANIVQTSYRECFLNTHLEKFLTKFETNFTTTLFSSVSRDANLTLDDYPSLAGDIGNVRALIQTPGSANILVQGPPGTGKTEFAKALAASIGVTVRFLTEGDGLEISERRCALVASSRILNNLPDILAVDEAEALLRCSQGDIFDMYRSGHSTQDKSWVNHFLESSNLKIIWILNSLSGIDESVRRRFDYFIQFRPLTSTQRLRIWKKYRDQENCQGIDDEDLSELAEEFNIPPAAIGKCFKNIGRIQAGDSASVSKTNLKKLAENQVHLIGGEFEERQNKPDKHYTIDGVRTDVDLGRIIKSVQRFCELSVKDSIEEKAPADMVRNVSILMSGAPGTGKTEFAKHLSSVTQKKLIVKRASDLLSMWVGGTEKGIKGAFKAAYDENGILFIDECDSFLQSRQNAVRNWEVSQVNELLTQMESYRGVLICATNFMENLDPASLRRFNFRVKFDFPGPDQVKDLFTKVIGSLLSETPTEAQWERISGIRSVSPGDFRNVRARLLLNQMVDGDSKHSVDGVIRDLVAEVAGKMEGMHAEIGFNRQI